jgi:hypothetical protein
MSGDSRSETTHNLENIIYVKINVGFPCFMSYAGKKKLEDFYIYKT